MRRYGRRYSYRNTDKHSHPHCYGNSFISMVIGIARAIRIHNCIDIANAI